jgi:hypothetical protein
MEFIARLQDFNEDDSGSPVGSRRVIQRKRYDLGVQVQPLKRGLLSLPQLAPRRLGEVAAVPENGVIPRHSAGLAVTAGSAPRFSLSLLYRRPTVIAATLFLLILSGPPQFRIRDPEASLRGDMDWVVALHAVVWGAAGLWVLWQIAIRFQERRRLLRLRLPQILGLALVLTLALSAWKSEAPLFTAFKVYQMLVSMLFTQIFAERFGVWTLLKTTLWGNVLLAAAIALCAFLVPDEVWTASEFNPDPSRLFGDLIAPTGVVAALAIILLLTNTYKVWRILPLCLLSGLFALLLLSLMRTAYIAIFVFFAIVLLKRPNIKPLRRIAYVLCLLLVMLYAFGRLPSISDYRDPGTVSNLGDRIGLWRYLTAETVSRSPWLGLGYYSASRIYGPEYNPGLGTAHSMFIEVLAGGGILSFALILALCATLSTYALRLLLSRRDRLTFALSTLFITSLLFGFMGDEIHSGPVAIGFWISVAALPVMYESFKKKAPQALGVGVDANA